MIRTIVTAIAAICSLHITTSVAPAIAETQSEPLIIGLDADLSGGSAKAGEAIRRGMEIAIDEINAGGGVLGRPLVIEAKDHRGNPARGADNLSEFAEDPNVVAVMGGLHTPVVMHELPLIHEKKIPFLVPWAAGTSIITNGYTPNYIFRVSVRDQYAGGYLVDYAVKQGYRRIALALEKTGWGRSNEKALTFALARSNLSPVAVTWFHWGDSDDQSVLEDILAANADAILLVGNAPEGLKIAEEMAALPEQQRIPIISHWGITGGNFFEQAKNDLSKIDLTFLQTYSFFHPGNPIIARRVLKAYALKYGVPEKPESIFAPAGTAHAYDLVHLLGMAIREAGSTDRQRVRNALQKVQDYVGLVRRYILPFDNSNQDALSVYDYKMARYNQDGAIIPITED